MQSYPKAIVPVGHVEPVPRRIRAYVGGVPMLDTTGARYLWEAPAYPQYYVPLADVDQELLVDEGRVERTSCGTAQVHGIRAGDTVRPSAARVLGDDGPAALSGTVRFEWTALDAWFEEDEEVFVHPRSPYSRVDALRSTRRVRVELDGVLLAESVSPVLVFETGLPTRYYLGRTDVDLTRLVPSDTRTACPYKGRTTDYWSVRTDASVHPDLAWSYGFPTGALGPVAGLIAFYNEHVDLVVDGRPLDRPRTAFS